MRSTKNIRTKLPYFLDYIKLMVAASVKLLPDLIQ